MVFGMPKSKPMKIRGSVMKKLLTIAITLSLVPVTAASADNEKDQSADMGDPNRVICEKVKVIGSRLAVKKTRHTAAEWADMKREARTAVDRVQGFKPCQIGGCRSEEHTSELQSQMRNSYSL